MGFLLVAVILVWATRGSRIGRYLNIIACKLWCYIFKNASQRALLAETRIKAFMVLYVMCDFFP